MTRMSPAKQAAALVELDKWLHASVKGDVLDPDHIAQLIGLRVAPFNGQFRYHVDTKALLAKHGVEDTDGKWHKVR